MIRQFIILFLVFLSTLLDISKVSAQKKYALKELDYNAWSYKYKASSNSFSPKSQDAVYWKPVIDIAVHKITGREKAGQDYTVNKKVAVLFETDTITGNTDSAFVDAYLIHFDKEINAPPGVYKDLITMYEMPNYKHPYTTFTEEISARDILVTGVFKVWATISKEEQKRIITANDFLKKQYLLQNPKGIAADSTLEKAGTIAISSKFKSTFSFTKKWAYPWYVIKDEKTGRLENSMADKIKKQDTAHLYFTADCTTNVQGTYSIRYCDVVKDRDVLTLTFADGLPAYAGSFSITVKGNKFFFQPKLIYPSPQPVSKEYEIIKQELIMSKSSYSPGEKAEGYVNIAFRLKGNNSSEDVYYLKGFFKSPVIKQNKKN